METDPWTGQAKDLLSPEISRHQVRLYPQMMDFTETKNQLLERAVVMKSGYQQAGAANNPGLPVASSP